MQKKHFSDRVVDCGLKICYETGRSQGLVVEIVVGECEESDVNPLTLSGY